MGQAEHYDHILDDYERHYFDGTSMQYRREIIYPLLFSSLDLNGKDVIELACASGLNSSECARLFPRVHIIGADISPECCSAYVRNTGFLAKIADLSSPNLIVDQAYDAAFIVGGIHHCVNDLGSTMRNLARFVKPGGHLMMMEPNAGFFLNRVREWWYKKDKWFRAEEERPLFHDELLSLAKHDFELVSVKFLGGPAYFLILNSLITRIPPGMKPLLVQPLMLLEKLYNRLPGSKPYPMFIAQWRRLSA